MLRTSHSHVADVPAPIFKLTIGLDRSLGRSLGLFFNDNVFPFALRIEHVSNATSSLIGEWNARNPLSRVCIDDQVVAVNGNKGSATYLQQLISPLQFVELSILRPAELQAQSVPPTVQKRAADDTLTKNQLKRRNRNEKKKVARQRDNDAIAAAAEDMRIAKRMKEEATESVRKSYQEADA